MFVGARKEDDAGLIDDDLASLGVSDGQPSLFEHMEVTGLLVEVGRDAAEGSGVEHAGREGESFEEWGEEIHIKNQR